MALQFSGRELPGGTGYIEIAVGEAGAFERKVQAGITAEGTGLPAEGAGLPAEGRN